MHHVGVIAEHIFEPGFLGPLAKIIFFTVATTKSFFIKKTQAVDGPGRNGHAKTNRCWQ